VSNLILVIQENPKIFSPWVVHSVISLKQDVTPLVLKNQYGEINMISTKTLITAVSVLLAIVLSPLESMGASYTDGQENIGTVATGPINMKRYAITNSSMVGFTNGASLEMLGTNLLLKTGGTTNIIVTSGNIGSYSVGGYVLTNDPVYMATVEKANSAVSTNTVIIINDETQKIANANFTVTGVTGEQTNRWDSITNFWGSMTNLVLTNASLAYVSFTNGTLYVGTNEDTFLREETLWIAASNLVVYSNSAEYQNLVTNTASKSQGLLATTALQSNQVGALAYSNSLTYTDVGGASSNQGALADGAWQNPVSATNWGWSKTATEVTLTNYNFASMDVVIPDMLDGLPVVTWNAVIFASSAITSVSGGKNLKIVGSLYNCQSLLTVDLPFAEDIRSGAMADCWAVSSINLPNLRSMEGANTFRFCYSLTSISLPRVTVLDTGSFASCTNLVSIDAPSLTAVGWGAFSGCKNLTTVIAPKLQSCFAQTSFANCTSLASISFPELISIGAECFKECTSLTNAYLPKLAGAGTGAFKGCASLITLTVSSDAFPAGSVFDSGSPTIEVTNPTAKGWGETFEGWVPVVRLPLFGPGSNLTHITADQVGAVGTNKTITVNGVTSNLNDNPSFTIASGTNFPYTAITNSPWATTNQIGSTAITDILLSGSLLYDAEGSNLQFEVECSTNQDFSNAMKFQTTNSVSGWYYFNGSIMAPLTTNGLVGAYQDTNGTAFVQFTTNIAFNGAYVRARSWDGVDYSNYRVGYGKMVISVGK
jgi:hypothetical protein